MITFLACDIPPLFILVIETSVLKRSLYNSLGMSLKFLQIFVFFEIIVEKQIYASYSEY